MFFASGAVNMASSAPNDRLDGYVSASRLQLDQKQLAKASDGDAIVPIRTRLLPDTGIEPLDGTAQRVNAVANYAPEAVSQTSSATLRGGLYGGACGFIIGLASQGAGIIGDLLSRRPPAGAVVLLLFTGIGALLGSALGFFKSTRKNAEAFKTMLFQGQQAATFSGSLPE
jgi:hypothetical protein